MNRSLSAALSAFAILAVVTTAYAQQHVRPKMVFPFQKVDTSPTQKNTEGETVELIHSTKEMISRKSYLIQGCHDLVSGSRAGSKGLMFDGYTTRIHVPAGDMPDFSKGITIRTTVALGAYPWNWTPIAAQEKTISKNEQRKKTNWPQTIVKDAKQAGWYVGIGPRGQVAFMFAVDGKWHICSSEDFAVKLKKWCSIGATYDPKSGASLYVDGKKVGFVKTSGPIDPAKVDMVIGMNRQMRKQAFPIRPHATLPCWWSLDGIMDGLAIWDQPTSDQSMQRQLPGDIIPPKFDPRIMPSGPDRPMPFGAYYHHLKYYRQWDRLWRVGSDPDVVVRFDNSPVKVVFWRGTRFGPAWVSENGLWMGDQSIENFNGEDGCIEHMLDPHCRFSHVRVIESNPARAIVHWRYCPVAANGNHSQVDERSGWADWVDEYYYFYPDQVGMRHVVLRTKGRFLWPQEVIGLCHPGQRPEDVVDLSALTLVNLKGKEHTYTWGKEAPRIRAKTGKMNYAHFGGDPSDPDDKTYEDADQDQPVVVQVHTKSKNQPFLVVEPDSWMAIFGIERRPDVSYFPWWNHWPVAQLPSDGRDCQAADRASHFSLAWASPLEHQDNDTQTFWWALMYGMSDKPAKAKIPLAASWLHAPECTASGDGYSGGDYSFQKRNYTIKCDSDTNTGPLKLTFDASEKSPVHNLPLVIENFGRRWVQVKVDGKQLSHRDRQYRTGYSMRLDKTDLVLFIDAKSTKPLEVEITPYQRQRQ